MHRLYWKIFIAFWLAFFLFIGAALFSASFYLEQTRRQINEENPRERYFQLLSEARLIGASSSTAGLKRWLAELDRYEIVPYYLVDADDSDLLGRELPPHLAVRLSSPRASRDHRRGRLPRDSVMTADDGMYRLIPDFAGVNLWRLLERPRVFAIPLLVAALVSGLLCYWLARYLLRPVFQLRDATHRVAGGDLGSRVAPALGDRRDEIADLARDFDNMTARLEQLMASQIRMIGDISHELRSPLARLQVALELEQRKHPGPSRELERIARETERMDRLIGQILILARLDSGARTLHAQPLELDHLLDELVDNANFEIAPDDKSVQIVEREKLQFEGDPELIASALENVIRNAARYTAPATRVEVALRLEGETAAQRAVIVVRDRGPGAAEEQLARLFDPFFRTGEARDRDSGGHGLGLAIAARAIALHGGSIAAANADGGGLSITIRLPLAADAP